MGVDEILLTGIAVGFFPVLEGDVVSKAESIHQWLDGFLLHIGQVVITAPFTALR
ncbi:hypothetical protein D3C78_1994430 [compost metagenome]